MAVYTPMLTPKMMESTVASVTSCSEAEMRLAMAGATGDWSGLRPQFHWVKMPLSQRTYRMMTGVWSLMLARSSDRLIDAIGGCGLRDM